MAQKDIQVRHASIINKLNTGKYTFREIQQYIAQVGEIQGYQLNTSPKTFKRDRQDILSLYRIDIQCHKPTNRYFISIGDSAQLNDRLLDALNILNSVNTSVGLEPCFDLEARARSGTEFIVEILYAIRQRRQFELYYQSYWDEVSTLRITHPYFIKEYKNRWYLVAKDVIKAEVRTYALDRIKEVSVSKLKFIYPEGVSATSYFKKSFGIITGNDSPVEEVVLSFEFHQGMYIKSLPLHKSQQIVSDTHEGLIVKLSVQLTFDFEMHLLSYGETVNVLRPEGLRKRMRERLEKALKAYQ